jgi:hypothetical protein
MPVDSVDPKHVLEKMMENLAQISCFPEVYAMAGAVASRVVG